MTRTGPISSQRLKSFIERVEKLIEERSAIGGDIRDVFSEAKGVGYNVPIMRRVITLRAMDAADRAEQETLLDTYMHALESVDRVEARVAAGDSVRKAAAAEGMSKSTAARRVSQNREKAGNGTDAPGTPSHPGGQTFQAGADARSEPNEPAAQAVNAGLPSGRVSAIIDDSQGSEVGTITEDRPATALDAELIERVHEGLKARGDLPPDATLTINEIHRGAKQPEGCAKVMRADPSMSGSAVASGGAVRDAHAMPLDVVAAPHSEGREHAGSAATAPPACSDLENAAPASPEEPPPDLVREIDPDAMAEAIAAATDEPRLPHPVVAAAKKLMAGGNLTVEVRATPGSLLDRVGAALEQVAPGKVQRNVSVGAAPDDDLQIPAFLRRTDAKAADA